MHLLYFKDFISKEEKKLCSETWYKKKQLKLSVSPNKGIVSKLNTEESPKTSSTRLE